MSKHRNLAHKRRNQQRRATLEETQAKPPPDPTRAHRNLEQTVYVARGYEGSDVFEPVTYLVGLER